MKSNYWRTAFEVIGLIAVVASLIFVGLQLRQDQVIARSELGASSFVHLAEIHGTLSDPAFAAIYSKMLVTPGDLSINEQVAVNEHLSQVTELFSRVCYLVETGFYAECDSTINRLAPTYFGNSYAQSWWNESQKGQKSRPFLSGSWQDKVDKKIAATSPDFEIQRLKRILEGVK